MRMVIGFFGTLNGFILRLQAFLLFDFLAHVTGYIFLLRIKSLAIFFANKVMSFFT